MSDDLNVPEELSVASGFGTPDLDAEAPTTDTLDHLDTLLDEAIEETGESDADNTEVEDDSKLSEEAFGGEAKPTEPEPTYEEPEPTTPQ